MFKLKSQSVPSIIIVILALCAILTGGLALVGGLGIHKTAKSAAEEQDKTLGAQTVTDCYESRVTYTAVSRTENVVPNYAYPNIKCSKATGGVLWYGDPFDGTIPMGQMPEVNDRTRGDFTNAVVRPREPHLTYFNMGPNGCVSCHDGKTVPFPKDKKPRLLVFHQDTVEDSMQLKHGRGTLWCLDCHNATNRNKLIDRQGNEISFNQPQRLCGTCHGEVTIDWRSGIHGKRIGAWATGGKRRWWVCTECHNPHTVQIERFNPLQPEPPPTLPRGMINAEYERVGDGEH